MKKNSIISLIIFCSFFAGIFGAAMAIKILSKNDIYKSDLTGDKIISMQKELENIKLEKSLEKTVNNVGSLEDTIINITKENSDGVVSIIVKKDLIVYKSDPWGFFKQPVGSVEKKVGGGTGFFITKDGKIITNKHVVSDKNAEYTVITNNGEEFEAKILALDPLSDLAIIKIEVGEKMDIKPLVFIENKKDIKIGQFVIAIGNKLGEFENSVSLGLVSGIDRIIKDKNISLSNLIQTDADIHPGNSGGPLVNLEGKVIGINTAIVKNIQSIGFAIQTSKRKIKYMLDSIEKYGDIKRPLLGINYIAISKGIKEELGLRSEKGIYIINEPGSVIKGSSAEKIGLEPGDIISEVDEVKLEGKNTLQSIIQWKVPGEIIKIKVIKPSGEIKRLKLTLGSS